MMLKMSNSTTQNVSASFHTLLFVLLIHLSGRNNIGSCRKTPPFFKCSPSANGGRKHMYRVCHYCTQMLHVAVCHLFTFLHIEPFCGVGGWKLMIF